MMNKHTTGNAMADLAVESALDDVYATSNPGDEYERVASAAYNAGRVAIERADSIRSEVERGHVDGVRAGSEADMQVWLAHIAGAAYVAGMTERGLV